MSKLYFPILYMFHTRFNDKILNLVENVSSKVIPLLISAYLINNINLLVLVGYSIIGYVMFYSMYEIGYYTNDTRSIQFERSPTKYLDTNVKINIYIFIGFRLFILLFCAFWVYESFGYAVLAPLLVIIFLTQAVFWLHNSLYEDYRIITFFSLYFLKYYFFFCLFEINKLFIPILFALSAIPYYLDKKKLIDLGELKYYVEYLINIIGLSIMWGVLYINIQLFLVLVVFNVIILIYKYVKRNKK